MVAPISYADKLDPFITLELPPGWVRDLLGPLSGSFRSGDSLESTLLEALTGSKPDSAPTSSIVIFTYFAGYDLGIDRPIDSERQLSIKYVAEQDALGVRAAFDEGLVKAVPDARDWPERTMPRVEREMDHRRRFWVTLPDIHGLGRQGIDNPNGEYESLGTVASATGTELVDIPYVTDDLAPEVVEAAEQFDGTIPDAPGDRTADCTDDPFVVDTNDLRPFSGLFENWTPTVLNLFSQAVAPVPTPLSVNWHTLLEELDELSDDAELVTPLSHDTFRVTDVQEHRVVVTFDDTGGRRPFQRDQFETLHRRIQDSNGALELDRLPPDTDPHPAVLSLHPWFEADEEQGSIAETKAETGTQLLSGESAPAESDRVEPDEIDVYPDALLLVDALERQDVSDLTALETEVLVNLYTLCSDVQRNADELR